MGDGEIAQEECARLIPPGEDERLRFGPGIEPDDFIGTA
jgi:hypothetical protein